MNCILSRAPIILHILRCSWHFLNWPLGRCSTEGKLRNSCGDTACSERPWSWYMWCGDEVIIRSFVLFLTCVGAMWSVLSQTQTLASLVRKFRLVNCENSLLVQAECVLQQININEATVCVVNGFFTKHTHVCKRSAFVHAFPPTHLHSVHLLHTHTYNILPGFESICGSAQSPLHKLFVTNERVRGLLLWWSSEKIQLCQLEQHWHLILYTVSLALFLPTLHTYTRTYSAQRLWMD